MLPSVHFKKDHTELSMYLWTECEKAKPTGLNFVLDFSPNLSNFQQKISWNMQSRNSRKYCLHSLGMMKIM